MNYALMTFLFNFFELGCFLWAMQIFGLKRAAIVAVCVKVGRLCTETVRGRSPSIIIGVLATGIILGILSAYNWILACIAAPMTVYGISKIREHYKLRENPSKSYKTFSRIVAFCLAPLFNFWILIPFAAYIGVKVFHENISERKTKFFPNLGNSEWEYALLSVHHMHYFAYAFLIPYIATAIFNVNILLTGVIFIVGWGAYNIYESRVKYRLSYIAYGHILAAVGVGLIWYFSDNFFLIMLGWFLTGLGGGTFYMIKDNLPPDRNKSEVVELWGQLTGMSLFASAANVEYLMVVYVCAIIFAVITTAIAVFLERRTIWRK